LLYLPGEQYIQCVEPLVFSDTVPPGHKLQALAPGLLEKYPFAQLVHDTAREALYLPAGHMAGSLNPAAHEYPAGHIISPPLP